MTSTLSDQSVQAPRSECFKVTGIDWKNHLKRLRFGDGAMPLSVPRSACVTTGDKVRYSDQSVQMICNHGVVQLLPSYVALEHLTVGGSELDFVVKEITEPDEHTAYVGLAQYHYRGHVLHGRTARLIVRNFHPVYPAVVGYIELATPLYMNRPRTQILNVPFSMNGVAWECWDMNTIRKNINLVVRIARCVVYPEFRGIGLGQTLVKHAMEFARTRWQVAGVRPCFLEIAADMLRYVPFAQKAGMTYIGDTEGNINRVAKDMGYLLRNRQRVESGTILKGDVSGIVDQQVLRMTRAARIMEREGWDVDTLVGRLASLSHKNVLREYDRFQGIVSLPKPTYMRGLCAETDSFIRDRAIAIGAKNGHQAATIRTEPLASDVQLIDITISYNCKVRRTKKTHAIQQAFGISPDDMSHDVVRNFSMAVRAGDVILIAGASGSGKSSLLRLFAEGRDAVTNGEILWPDNYNPGVFRPIHSTKALIEVIGGGDVDQALNLMGKVGLSDAFVYLKRFQELSGGQQYRAMLANLISTACNVWIADEFCANLDPINAKSVAMRLQATARKRGATLIVASSQPGTFIQSLQPDQVVQLTSANEHRCVPGSDFIKALATHTMEYRAPSLRIAPQYLSRILSGLKRATIRKGRCQIGPGVLLLKVDDKLIAVNVDQTRFCHLKTVTLDEARADGFESVSDLQDAMADHYPDIRDSSWVTVIRFTLSCTITPPRTSSLYGEG